VLRRLRALAVLPTHDLAQQVARVLEPLCAACGLSLAVCSGKGALKPEAALLVDAQGQSLVDVLVTTPGRRVCVCVCGRGAAA
jgi:ATP-dependent RNA helicase DDX51/DBP6